MFPGDLGTKGGLVTDEYARVLDATAGGVGDHQFGAAGNRGPLAGRLGNQFENRGQSAGRDQFVCLGITAHDHPTDEDLSAGTPHEWPALGARRRQ